MKLNKEWKWKTINKRFLLQWSMAYIISALCALIILVANSYHAVKILHEQQEYTNNIQLEITRIRMDRNIKNLREIALKEGRSSLVKDIAETDIVDAKSRWNAYLLTNELSTEFRTLEQGENYYLYFPQSDLMVSETYYSDSKTYYTMDMSEYGYSYEEFREIIGGKYNSTQVFQPVNSMTGSTRYLIFVRPVSGIKKNAGSANAVLIFDLKELMQVSDWLLDSKLLIFNRNTKEIISSDVLTDDFTEKLPVLLIKQDGNNDTSFQLNDQMVSYIPSENENWDFLVVSKSTNMSSQISTIKRTLLLLMVLYAVITVFIIALDYRKNYSKIQNIMQALETNAGDMGDEAKSKDAYAYIDSGIRKLVKNNQQNFNMLELQRSAIQREMFRQLISSRDASRMFDRELFTKSGITIEESMKGCLLSYSIETDGTLIKNLDLMKFILRNVTEEMLHKEDLEYVLFPSEEAEVMFLIWEKTEISKNELIETVSLIQKNVREFMEANSDFQYKSALSGSHHGISGIYRENAEIQVIRELQKYENIKDCDYKNINMLPKDTLLEYPADKENQLLYSIRHGDIGASENVIEEILNLNKSNYLSSEAKQFLISKIMTTILREARVFSADSVVVMKQKKVIEATKSDDIDAMLDAILDFSKTICEKITNASKEKIKSEKSVQYQKIKDYIDANYQDPELNVNAIAEAFRTSASSLSKYFKSMNGDTLNRYITNIRLCKAREMIFTDASLEEISMECGFGSQRTFLRVFKAYEGVTPSQYKELNKREGYRLYENI
ncbi:hypothetical protein BXO88_14405 [Oribacterium sp. C9]|uniref:AraC family transcriptional regulator n=1 Tax=Oribacterium sp. C9 TaxID=1943579 RepID=UPI00098E90E1|nr:AraC family transcriptional regulator [Oribacterium sp. C9]OON85037.1 hypothetical protein BXO88_14405 [Oribacterium sp. C9]